MKRKPKEATETLGQRVAKLKGAEKNTAQEMLQTVRSAEDLAKGPDKKRAAHWLMAAIKRETDLKEFLWRNGA